MSRRVATIRSVVATSALLAMAAPGSTAHAAGGHHAVDDAALLDPDQCQVETWYDRHSVDATSLAHVGPGCRVGPVELGINLDRTIYTSGGTVMAAGAQVKYAHDITPSLALGIVVASAAQDTRAHYSSSSLVAPLTWTISEEWLMHVNVGRDFEPGQRDHAHDGLAFEWAPSTAWSYVAERFADTGRHFVRLGARWTAPSQAWNVDFSGARDTGGGEPPRWTIGATWLFGR